MSASLHTLKKYLQRLETIDALKLLDV